MPVAEIGFPPSRLVVNAGDLAQLMGVVWNKTCPFMYSKWPCSNSGSHDGFIMQPVANKNASGL